MEGTQRDPGYVFDLLKALPLTTHPMTMFSMAILAMHNESVSHRGILTA